MILRAPEDHINIRILQNMSVVSPLYWADDYVHFGALGCGLGWQGSVRGDL